MRIVTLVDTHHPLFLGLLVGNKWVGPLLIGPTKLMTTALLVGVGGALRQRSLDSLVELPAARVAVHLASLDTVSYTPLTLPTNYSV